MNTRYSKSLLSWESAKQYLVPGSSTISKHPKLYTFGAYPIYVESGKGAEVTDIDGNTYVDFQSSLGATILGTAYPEVVNAVIDQARKGSLFSLSTELPIRLAQILCDLIPSAERARILRNGSDATSAAVRIARAYTKRTKILSCHFHGWHDWYYVITSMNRGIPAHLKDDIQEFPYNDLAALENLFKKYPHEIAAIIMEPVHLEKPNKDYLKNVKKLAHTYGAVLIFDEVVTGFRFGLGGAQKHFGVTPDITCIAKALANGAPLSAVVGSAEIMDSTEDVITSMTYGEETLAIASAIATLDVLIREPVVDHIWKLGKLFQQKYNTLTKKYNVPSECIGLPPRMELTFTDSAVASRLHLKSYMLQESAKQGILFGNMIFINYSHTDEQISKALAVCETIFQKISKAKHASDIPLQGALCEQLW
ncbi:MAG: hypothetical protein RI947_723 [Candidatus Parcubacteria bacterium]